MQIHNENKTGYTRVTLDRAADTLYKSMQFERLYNGLVDELQDIWEGLCHQTDLVGTDDEICYCGELILRFLIEDFEDFRNL